MLGLWLLVLGATAAQAEESPQNVVVAVSFPAAGYVSCLSHLNALGMDGRTVLLPEGETKASLCHKLFPENYPPPVPPASSSSTTEMPPPSER
jgi:hypothetical protein